MQYTPISLSIENLVKMHKQTLKVNPEYQRGSAWSQPQKKMFIDSIHRDYPTPLIFLLEKKEVMQDPIAKKEQVLITYEVIDGQQRIEALAEYVGGKYKLIDLANEKEAKFPNFAQKTPYTWCGKVFEDLDEKLRKKFLETKISVIMIENIKDSEDEARDLFIRLQAGSALNDQEKRDAWPGDFTAFIFKIGGKHDLAGNTGHEFFEKIMHIKSSRTDRGKVRKIAAQMYQLCSSFSERKIFSPIKKESLDELYRINVAFDRKGESAKKFISVLDTLQKIFVDEGSRKMVNHEVFHLAVFVSSLLEDDAINKKWMSGLKNAYEDFRKNFTDASVIKDDEKRSVNEYWIHYVQHIKVSADSPDVIARRHEFFSKKMSEYMRKRNFLIYRDEQRLFTSVERESIYFRDDKKCLICGASVVWRDAEIHHVKPHADGGETILKNGALVHEKCHPKNKAGVQKAAELFEKKRNEIKYSRQKKSKKRNRIFLPDCTEARAFYNGKTYHAKISKGKWNLVNNEGSVYAIEKTPSGAARRATGKNLNGNKFWEVKRPDDDNWTLLDDLR